ncbi:MAG: hypothetical protein M3290_07785, partial [Actinomycetota bacterium]|nr:hypothetical protein [Actinomycetota bacterium]
HETGVAAPVKAVAELAAGHVARVLGRSLVWTHRTFADPAISRDPIAVGERSRDISDPATRNPITAVEVKEDALNAQS